MQASSADSSYHADCSKNLSAASTQGSTMQSPQEDAYKPKKPAEAATKVPDASKQLITGPAADHSQLPDGEGFSFYRPRARRLSEHGCGCCGLGLTLSNSPITETQSELQAAGAKMPVFWETDTASAPAPASEPVTGPDVTKLAAPAAGLSTNPSTELSTQRSFKFTSPFAGLTLSIPDDEQDQQQQQQQQQQKVEPNQPASGKHSSGSLSDVAAAALGSCQLVDDDGTPVPVFAIVSISFSKPANAAVL